MGIWRWLKQRWHRGEGPSDNKASQPLKPPVVRRHGISAKLPSDLLQFSRQPEGTITDVVVGFDFGTSSVKVAMQTPYALGGRTAIIDFGTLGHGSCSYLLPASVYRSDADRWTLCQPRGPAEHRCHLKLPLLGEIRDGQRTDEDSMAWAVAFMALALREARGVFLETQKDSYGGIPLRWAMNLGIPSAGYDDEVIRSRFLEAAKAAWRASLLCEVSGNTVANATAEAKASASDDMAIAVVPEVAAEMVGYARSRYRRAGLHLVIDIGASTLAARG